MFDTKKKKSSKKSEQGDLKYLGGLLLAKMAFGGAARLRSNADEVNKLNVFPVPDGDTGDNMRMTVESGIAAIENLDSDDLSEVMKVLSHGMLLGARGNSGVILSQFFAGISKGLVGTKKADPAILGHALELGVQQAYTSVMTPTEGTILTVAREAVEYAVKRITPQSTLRSFFADLVGEMHDSVDRTPEILSVLKEAGVVDSGGAGLFYIMDGFNRVLNGEEVAQDNVPAPTPAKAMPNLAAFGPDSVMTYGYCTELLVQLQHSKTDIDAFDIQALKDFLGGIGDSVVAFKTDSIVKLHVHTFTPEKVLAHCRAFGEFLTIKIENMKEQHTEKISMSEMQPVDAAPAVAAPEKKYGFAVVCAGAGVGELFRELGADQVVEGGQTMNPSTEDILKAVNATPAEIVIVLPNNKNIIMAAQQVDALTEKQVLVLETKTIPQGVSAMLAFDLEASVEDNREAMTEAFKMVRTAQITYAARNSNFDGLDIHEGDYLALAEGKMCYTGSDLSEAMRSVIAYLSAEGAEFFTVYRGEDATEDRNVIVDEMLV